MTGAESADTHHDTDWYRPTKLRRAAADRIAVLDIETTGLDSAADFVCELALVGLDGTPLANIMVQLPAGVARPNESFGAEFPSTTRCDYSRHTWPRSTW
ncbi:hypothetical protein BZL30_8637 [Mycobacterium kansasii]|uniref:Exonuclease domain-containing protein n=1 Tax=Mycobacterium kansasii TaxID=1768 RepID=A0A1V3WFB0_MYCKA|nr:hypothetical protein BZL30_8637 [Mycobacterium kansasii]